MPRCRRWLTAAPSFRGSTFRFASAPRSRWTRARRYRTTSSEYVALTAHLDHLGVGQAQSGDSIYNGAMDNASGIATLLEAATALGRGKTKPRRSLLFVAVTAEEKGLLGSDWFA